MTAVTALIADDEPLLREVLRSLLARHWPELQIVAEARNGVEALERFEALRPTVCFLDVHMPGLSGIEVAQRIGHRAHLVFITAYDHYALQAFEHGVFDYLVKPVQLERLAQTLARLQQRLRLEQPAVATEALLQQLAQQLQPAASAPATQPLRWIRAAVGGSVRLIPVDDIDYLKSDEKYTLVAWRGDSGRHAEALIRTSLKALLEQLDPAQFLQVHRAVVVNLNAVSHVTPDVNEKANLHFKHRPEVLPVSRTYLHHFKAE
ncbi:LytR/AlgR family response regulator transcription factor [Roseateles paludis]|jgi:DNA-binding LytR/AlgR family response regulator|uniref:LytTR family DNA-binding domain-containing protein n=1 Tax=Roseateles paludis TaxID=3145238 RepID=A0ABV0FX57_9BURK